MGHQRKWVLLAVKEKLTKKMHLLASILCDLGHLVIILEFRFMFLQPPHESPIEPVVQHPQTVEAVVRKASFMRKGSVSCHIALVVYEEAPAGTCIRFKVPGLVFPPRPTKLVPGLSDKDKTLACPPAGATGYYVGEIHIHTAATTSRRSGVTHSKRG